jgi:hypothetical protein
LGQTNTQQTEPKYMSAQFASALKPFGREADEQAYGLPFESMLDYLPCADWSEAQQLNALAAQSDQTVLPACISVGEASDAELQDAVFGPVTPGVDSSKSGGVISVEGVDADNEDFGPEYGFDDIAAMPDRREYFERIGDELRGSVVVDQPLSERLKNAGAAAYYGDPNTNTDGIESSVLFAKGFGEQLSDGWQELKADPFSIIRDPLTLAYDQIETAFYYGTGGLLGDPNSVARNQERAESLLNLGDAVKVSASDSEKAGYIFGGAILSVTTIIDGFIIKLFEGGIIELPFSASPH